MTQSKNILRNKDNRSHSCAQLKTDHFSGSVKYKKGGLGYGGIYQQGICKQCGNEGALWKDGICMSCIIEPPKQEYCDKCEKVTKRYPNGLCRNCVAKNISYNKFCLFCQKETLHQGRACRSHRILLKKAKDGSISIYKAKTGFQREEKLLIKDIKIFDDIKWFVRGQSVEIILPKGAIKIKDSNKMVKLNSVMINNNVSNWIKITYKTLNGRLNELLVTTDHPLPINNGIVKQAKDLCVGDYLISSFNNKKLLITQIQKVEITQNSYDVSTETGYFNINKKIRSHNCRSVLSPYIDTNNKPKYWGRFNIGVVTLNLVHIALSSKGNLEEFWRILDERAELIKKAHLQRVSYLKKATSDVAPILWQHGALARLKKGEPISKLFYNGYATISLGYAGIYETVYSLIGESHTSERGQELAIAILKKLNKYCDTWKEETGLAFSLYGTPLESTTGKLAKANLRDFGKIEEVTENEYVTNSYHICVREEINAFDKLTQEAVFQKLSTGGSISYVEVPNMVDNIPAVLEVIKHIYNTIMYAELNTRSDLCHICGYDGEITQTRTEFGKFTWKCPNCGNEDINKMTVIRRVCGYLGSVGNGVGDGRLGDYNDRVLHL